jgi:hypothetical protein
MRKKPSLNTTPAAAFAYVLGLPSIAFERPFQLVPRFSRRASGLKRAAFGSNDSAKIVELQVCLHDAVRDGV